MAKTNQKFAPPKVGDTVNHTISPGSPVHQATGRLGIIQGNVAFVDEKQKGRLINLEISTPKGIVKIKDVPYAPPGNTSGPDEDKTETTGDWHWPESGQNT